VVPTAGEAVDAWRTPVPGCRTVLLSASHEGTVARFTRAGSAWTCVLGDRETTFG
jgi:hypothetical protein